MANEGERPTSADKGKGKVEDVRELNGKKAQKEEKAPEDGKKKDEEPQEGRLGLALFDHPGAEYTACVEHSYAINTKMLTVYYLKRSSVRRISS